MEFPLSISCVLQSTLPLSKALLRSTLYYRSGLLMCFVSQPPSNSLFVAVTDYYYSLTSTTDLSDDGKLVVGEYTLTISWSPKRRLWASLYVLVC